MNLKQTKAALVEESKPGIIQRSYPVVIITFFICGLLIGGRRGGLLRSFRLDYLLMPVGIIFIIVVTLLVYLLVFAKGYYQIGYLQVNEDTVQVIKNKSFVETLSRKELSASTFETISRLENNFQTACVTEWKFNVGEKNYAFQLMFDNKQRRDEFIELFSPSQSISIV